MLIIFNLMDLLFSFDDAALVNGEDINRTRSNCSDIELLRELLISFFWQLVVLPHYCFSAI